MTHGTQHPGVLGRLAGNPWLEPLQSVVITAAAAGVLAAGRGHLATIPAPFRLPWWVVALLSMLVALYLIRIEFRHDTTEFVLDQIVLVAGLFLASPAALMTGRTIGVVAATAVQTRARWRRGSFASGLAPGQLELDITQSTVLEEDEAMRGRLATLRQLGVRLTIDDFGTGYSSLSHLRRLPVDSVKIDGSFVAALADPDQDPALTRALVRLAQTLDLQVVAEGVETAEQLRLLIELRCPLGQGTYLVPPLPAEAMTRLLAGGPLEELAPAGRAGVAKPGPGWDAAPER